MTLLPVIERELRAESRGAFTYWLRFCGAAALLTAGVIFFVNAGLGNMDGGQLFRTMHTVLFVAIWVVGTLMTADAISRERREGTLGLLFLTPLRPFAVVLAKGMAHGLRAAGVALAAVPMLVVPFLMGGVTWREALASALINFIALCLALTVGLFASSLCRTMTRALVTAAILEIASLVTLMLASGALFYSMLSVFGLFGRNREPSLDQLVELGWRLLFAPDIFFGRLSRAGFGLPPPFMNAWLWTLVIIAAVTVVLCLLVTVLAAQNVRRAARHKERSVALDAVEKQFCTPTFAVGFYRKWMRRTLERNPVGWLERRTWQARLVTWAWLAVMISVLSWVVSGGFSRASEVAGPFVFLGCVLAGNIALTAAGSLRRERESGVIELMLVSPLTVQRIIRGRLRGIAGQFVPAAVFLFAIWLWLLHAFSAPGFGYAHTGEQFVLIGWLALTMVVLPAVGLYFSLRCRVFVVAAFWTAAAGFVLPWLASCALWWGLHAGTHSLALPLTVWVNESWPFLFGGAVLLWLLRYRKWAIASALPALAGIAYSLDDRSPFEAEPLLALVLICGALQIGVAFFLASRLRRRLERREFALPQ